METGRTGNPASVTLVTGVTASDSSRPRCHPAEEYPELPPLGSHDTSSANDVYPSDSVVDQATQSAAPSVLMLAARPNLSGPVPKIVPHQVTMLESQGYSVEVGYWGGRCDKETMLHKLLGGTLDLAKALRSLHAGSHAILFVNTAHGLKPFLRDIPLLLLTRGHGVRRILLLHGSQVDRLAHLGNSVFKVASRFIARSADGLLVLSTAEYASWRTFEPRGHYATVLNPFVPGAELIEAAGEHDLAATIDREERSIIFAGRLIREKGVVDLLEALRRVNDVLPCRLILAGTGPLANQLMAQARAWGLDDRVDFRGYLDTDGLAHAYASAELFVLPTYWDEGFPTVLAEAMSVGLPVITTRIRGSADLLSEGENCLFVLPRDPVQLAARILTLLNDTELARRMSSANRSRIASFRPDVVGTAYSRAFELAISNRPAR